MNYCTCLFCRKPRALLIEQSDDELFHVVFEKRDDSHAVFRVAAYIELYYRAGVFDQDMPYRVWRNVMGDTPPPYSGATGAFTRFLPVHGSPVSVPLH